MSGPECKEEDQENEACDDEENEEEEEKDDEEEENNDDDDDDEVEEQEEEDEGISTRLRSRSLASRALSFMLGLRNEDEDSPSRSDHLSRFKTLPQPPQPLKHELAWRLNADTNGINKRQCCGLAIKLWDLRCCMLSEQEAKTLSEGPGVPRFRWDYRLLEAGSEGTES